jgi:hypothetical protein
MCPQSRPPLRVIFDLARGRDDTCVGVTTMESAVVFVRLSNTFDYHALLYDIEVFSVLPIKDLRNAK